VGVFPLSDIWEGFPMALTDTEIRRSKPGDKLQTVRRRRPSLDGHSDRRQALTLEVPLRMCGKADGAGPLPRDRAVGVGRTGLGD
jgi:hypothetical protein